MSTTAATTALSKLFLVRHGDTAWTDSHRHTGRTDLPLTEAGERHARLIAEALPPPGSFARVFTSPLLRASKTCELAGFAAAAAVDRDLLEWDYGELEGLTTPEILARRPGWELFRDGCPGGESPADVAARADRFVARALDARGPVLAFSSGHLIRMIAARWLGLPPAQGRFFFCQPGSLGELGFEHDSREQPVVCVWNHAPPTRS
jgi:probable phosphoglycerate mutase